MFGSMVAAENSSSDLEEKSLQMKVMTYNIRHGEGMDGKLDLERIAEQIRQSNADIIGLQEVDNHWSERSDFKNQAKELAEMLDMHYVFGPNLNYPPEEGQAHNHQYGTAILSKYPILDSKNYKLTKLTDDEEQRGLLEAQVYVAGGEVWFYVTHTSHLSSNVRARQVEDIVEITSRHNNNVLVGDLNATPNATEMQSLFQIYTDVWSVNHDGLGYTYPADSPTKRIDYVLTSPRLNVSSSQVNHSLASDHLPLVADITIKPGENPLHADGMTKLIEYFEETGLITNKGAVHSLIMHLKTVSHFEGKNLPQKVVKHLNGFQTLINQQKKNQLISDEVYQKLKRDAAYLINKWQRLDLGDPWLEESREKKEIAPGLSHTHIDRGNPTENNGVQNTGPWNINVLEVNPDKFKGEIRSFLSNDVVNGKEQLTSISQRMNSLAAVNGGYFVVGANDGTPGDLAGVSMVNGEVVSESVGDRTSLLFSDSIENKASIANVETDLKAISSNGEKSIIDGLNRKPGLIRSCGGTSEDERKEDPKHDVTCTDDDELILFKPIFGDETPAGNGLEVVLDAKGKVTDIRHNRGGNIPVNGAVLAATGDTIKWLSQNAQIGMSIEVETHLSLDRKSVPAKRYTSIINGGPRILDDGKIDIHSEEEGFRWSEDFFNSFVKSRHPRTLAGIKANGNIIFVTVDGRDPMNSVGVTFEESAKLMKSLGAYEAMNLDGGGSTTMTVGSQLINHPSDNSGERDIGDAILFLPK